MEQTVTMCITVEIHILTVEEIKNLAELKII